MNFEYNPDQVKAIQQEAMDKHNAKNIARKILEEDGDVVLNAPERQGVVNHTLTYDPKRQLLK